jgi:hypothetical protein
MRPNAILNAAVQNNTSDFVAIGIVADGCAIYDDVSVVDSVVLSGVIDGLHPQHVKHEPFAVEEQPLPVEY